VEREDEVAAARKPRRVVETMDAVPALERIGTSASASGRDSIGTIVRIADPSDTVLL
jgi:hypothetical protein